MSSIAADSAPVCIEVEDDDDSWTTCLSFTDVDSDDDKSSVYAFDYYVPIKRSLSQLSIQTAEPIDYEYPDDLTPRAEESVSEYSDDDRSLQETFNEYDVPYGGGDYSYCSSRMSCLNSTCDVESVLHYTRSLKEPPSYYQVMELNHDPVDMAPRLTNVPSQYHLDEMREYSALQTLPAIQKLKFDTCNNDVSFIEKQVREPTSTYCFEL
uniref:Uncharacterized protein n=1 Tax=Panagrolaimus sp. JU765 TaxID=591449 RepID=A0AC34QI30_9BILA